MADEEIQGNVSPGGDQPSGGGSPSGDGRDPSGSSSGEGVSSATKRRESALEALKRELAETEIEMPELEGHSLRKARKILDFTGFPLDRIRLRYVEDSSSDRGTVVRQSPAPGEHVDLQSAMERVRLDVSEESLIRWLPSIYQRSDITGRNFLKDFLWIFHHLFNQTEEKLERLETYFDPLEAPPEFLEWLASWVALTLDEDWPEEKKRNVIKKAVELYQLRGTSRGLLVYLKLFTGVEPTIHENVWPFDGIQIGETATVGVDTILMHRAERAHCFTVELPMSIGEIELDTVKKIHQLIEREKPAHTDYYVIFAPEEEEEVDVGFVVGERSTIGVDTWIATDGSGSTGPAGQETGGSNPSEVGGT